MGIPNDFLRRGNALVPNWGVMSDRWIDCRTHWSTPLARDAVLDGGDS